MLNFNINYLLFSHHDFSTQRIVLFLAKLEVLKIYVALRALYIIPQCVELNSHPFQIIYVIREKIMLQYLGNLKQQESVHTFTLENIVHISTVAT